MFRIFIKKRIKMVHNSSANVGSFRQIFSGSKVTNTLFAFRAGQKKNFSTMFKWSITREKCKPHLKVKLCSDIIIIDSTTWGNQLTISNDQHRSSAEKNFNWNKNIVRLFTTYPASSIYIRSRQYIKVTSSEDWIYKSCPVQQSGK